MHFYSLIVLGRGRLGFVCNRVVGVHSRPCMDREKERKLLYMEKCICEGMATTQQMN